MGNEVAGDDLGEQYKGYVFKITGGNDKDGFTMKQGVLVNGRVRLLLKKGSKNYRPRRAGERKKKSVRGCIVGPDIAVLALSIAKRGEKDIDGLTNINNPNRLHVKRASKIRKLYNLTKEDDVKLYIAKVGREIAKKEGATGGKKLRKKRAKIQRLITDVRIRRKKVMRVECEKRRERTTKLKEEYQKLVSKLRSAKAQEHKAEEAAKVEPPKPTKPTGKAAPVTKGKVAETKGKPVTTTTATKAGTTAPVKKEVKAPAPVQAAPVTKKAEPVKKEEKKPAPKPAPKK